MAKSNGEGHIGLDNVNLRMPDEHQIALSQHVLSAAQKDANMPAPTNLGTRLKDATIEGIEKIPQGFVNSFDWHNILPNVAGGFAIGGAARLILPEGGPITRVAGLVLGAYFLGKPLAEGYYDAAVAKTMGDMHQASDVLGNTVGGLPVAFVEGGIGARLGSGLVGRALATQAAAPFTAWKEYRWNPSPVNSARYVISRLGIDTRWTVNKEGQFQNAFWDGEQMVYGHAAGAFEHTHS